MKKSVELHKGRSTKNTGRRILRIDPVQLSGEIVIHLSVTILIFTF